MLPDRDSATGAEADNHPTLTSPPPGACFDLHLTADGIERIADMSMGCAALWGVESDRIEEDASRLWALLAPQDLNDLRSALQQSAAPIQEWTREWHIQTPSGTRKWVHAMGRPEKTGNGGIVWRIMVMDTTHSRRAEASVRDNSARFRQLLDSVANVSVQGYARDMTTRYWNKASERLYGYTAEEAIGKNLLNLCTNAWQCMPNGKGGTITVTLQAYEGLPPNTDAGTLTQLGLGEQTVHT